MTGFDPDWEAFVKKRATKVKAAVAAETDTLDEESMVRYGGFVGDNEDDTREATTAREQIIKSRKGPAKGLYVSFYFIYFHFALTLVTP